MKILMYILIGIGLFIFLKRRYWNTFIIRKYFKKLSIMVCGKRGSGKDTLFSYIVYNKKNNSNIKINKKTNVINLEQINIPNLSRKDLVNGKVGFANYEDYKQFENITLISDSGIYYPSFDDTQLKKDYPSFAISIAIWRHLYNSPLHFNCQVHDRLWKLLREQIEDIIKCLSCKRGLLYTKLKVRYYENANDCENNLKPLHKSFWRNQEISIENSKRGLIQDFTLLIPNRMITHNTRAFKDIVFKKGDQNELI